MRQSGLSQVIGEVVGQVIGEVMGEESGLDGVMSTIGRHRHHRGSLLALPPQAPWRAATNGMPTGVNAPSEGLEPLPLNPDLQGGVFTNPGAPIITWTARPQRPFRAERFLAQVGRAGATAAAGVFANAQGVFVGTVLQQLQLGGFNIEFFGSGAFGVRMDLSPAAAGLDITVPVTLGGALLAVGDSVAVTMMFLGSSVR